MCSLGIDMGISIYQFWGEETSCLDRGRSNVETATSISREKTVVYGWFAPVPLFNTWWPQAANISSAAYLTI